MSIRMRLTLLYSGILALTLLLFGTFLYFFLQYTLLEEMDNVLANKAVEVFNSIKITHTYPYPLHQVVLPDVDIFAAAPDVFLQVIDRHGQIVAKSSNLGHQSLPINSETIARAAQEGPLYQTYHLPNGKLRTYILPLYLDESLVGIIQVGRPLGAITEALKNLRLVLLTGTSLAILVAASTGFAMARSALKPIEKITKEASSIGDHQDLSRRIAYSGPPDEVGQLASTFNSMLARLEKAYEQLDKSYAAQKRFVADASHELRTPLTTIRGNVELLEKMGDQDPQTRAEALQDIKSEAERMSRLVNELLTLARADAGHEPEKSPVELCPLFQEIFRQAKLLNPQVHFQHFDPQELAHLTLMGNADYLKQLFLILLDNAFKFTPAGGEVSVSYEKQGNQLHIKVKDTGPGIPEEELPNIFQRFYQVNPHRDSKGTGLGLAIAQWIAQIHNAEIQVESKVGEGSTFQVTFSQIF